jgi:hypothetical protein
VVGRRATPSELIVIGRLRSSLSAVAGLMQPSRTANEISKSRGHCEPHNAINALDGSLASPMLEFLSPVQFTERARLLGGFAMAIPACPAHTDGLPWPSHHSAIWRGFETVAHCRPRSLSNQGASLLCRTIPSGSAINSTPFWSCCGSICSCLFSVTIYLGRVANMASDTYLHLPPRSPSLSLALGYRGGIGFVGSPRD